ncbi:MAG: hypothetical protein L3J84_07400 [Gammaproteobacteria bacterium]|nr:hypothetical protein [Gammaproteobacteria bacterium]
MRKLEENEIKLQAFKDKLQAGSYLKAGIQRFDWLAENPTLGKPRDDIKQGYFCFPQGLQHIFYVIKFRNKKFRVTCFEK